MWQVQHESFRIENGPIIGNYGEVNGFLRNRADHIDGVDRLGVIVRDPVAIMRSSYYRARHRWDELLKRLSSDLKHLDRLLRLPNVTKIEFSRMTESKDYLGCASRALGIDNLDLDTVDMTPCNSSPPGELTREQYYQVAKEASWFWEKWL
jgi:hypothetical protein